MNLWLPGGWMGGRQDIRDGHVHTAIFTMDNHQGPTEQHVHMYG